jgi:hypothetical protein
VQCQATLREAIKKKSGIVIYRSKLHATMGRVP